MDTLSLEFITEIYKNGHQEGVVRNSDLDWGFREASVWAFVQEELDRRVNRARMIAKAAEGFKKE